MNAIAARTGFVAELQWPAPRLPKAFNQFLQRRGGVGKCAIRRGLPNITRGGDRDDDRLLVHVHSDKSRRLFHDPSPVPEAPRQTIRRDLRSCTWRDGSPLQGGHGSSGEGAQADAANTDRLVPRALPLAGPGQSPGLTSLPGFLGPEADMRSIARAIDTRGLVAPDPFDVLPRANDLAAIENATANIGPIAYPPLCD
jgi:hypothetical protein